MFVEGILYKLMLYHIGVKYGDGFRGCFLFIQTKFSLVCFSVFDGEILFFFFSYTSILCCIEKLKTKELLMWQLCVFLLVILNNSFFVFSARLYSVNKSM